MAEKQKGCIGCIHCGACHNCHGQSRYVDKRQMTEKQAIQMINDCKLSGFVLAMLRQNGYISESELEQQSSTKEKPMTEKVIFESDEDALDVASDCIDPECKLPNHDELVRNFMKNVRSKGYIRKSELAQLVDEAEDIIKELTVIYKPDIRFQLSRLYTIIQSLKKEVIRLGGKI